MEHLNLTTRDISTVSKPSGTLAPTVSSNNILKMTTSTRLSQLTALIAEKTAEVDCYIQEKNLPQPSFNASYLPGLELQGSVSVARSAALEAIDELRAHLLGPMGCLYDAVTNVYANSLLPF
jgi:hypothetical protein